MAQQGVERRGLQNHDVARTARMAFYGGCIFGPAATTWFGFLQRKVVFPGRPNLEIVARVAADQCIFAGCNLFVFLSTMAMLEGTDPKKKLETTYFNALKKNWMVWPAVQFTNFKFVPLEHRVLVVNIISLGGYLLWSDGGCGLLIDPRRMELLPQLPQQPAKRRSECRKDLPAGRVVYDRRIGAFTFQEQRAEHAQLRSRCTNSHRYKPFRHAEHGGGKIEP
ncbi:Protein sym-1 [Teratosphaeria destructans]|uniref:Protein sym-1 n=1 Tax=Teratosphaeria destructans TaxID=418781 RepID=A0A9W7SQM3_9PEZI|nr:Protein sym-1 [Teratosphaeria destructans]